MKIPKEISVLKDDLLWSYYDIDEYKEIYFRDQNELDILNDTALNFFVKLKEYFWCRFILNVCRFIDPLEQLGNRNLSLEILIKLADDKQLPFISELNKEIKIIKQLAKPFKTYRSKLIVHRDLNYATIEDLKPDEVFIGQVEKILSKIGNCINFFYEHYEKSSWQFQGSLKISGVQSLLYYLKQGAIYVDLKESRGNYQLDDKEEKESKYSKNI